MNSKRQIAFLIGFVVLCEIAFAVLMKSIASTSPGFEVYDMKCWYSITNFHKNLEYLNPESFQALILFRLLDTIFPLIYGLLLYKWLKHVSVVHKLILAIPFLGMASDYLENILLTFKTFFTNQHDYMIYITNVLTITKFTCIFITIIFIIYFGKKGREKHANTRNKTSID